MTGINLPLDAIFPGRIDLASGVATSEMGHAAKKCRDSLKRSRLSYRVLFSDWNRLSVEG